MSTNYDVRPAPPKPDLSKYPQIPKGACLNWNKTTRTFQVYLHAYKTDSATGEKKKTRISLGALKENGDYQISRTWQLSREKEELQNLLREAGSADAERAGKAVEALSSAASEAKIDTRQQSKVVHSLDAVLLGTVLMSLSGHSDAASISDGINCRIRKTVFEPYMPDLISKKPVSYDTVRKLMMLADPAKFWSLCRTLTAGLASDIEGRVIAADGQAVKATAKSGDHGARMIMNFYDASGRVCIGEKLIDLKTNEITAGPEILESLNVTGATVTVDAMSCQTAFAGKIIEKGAHWLFALKGNQGRVATEALAAFSSYEGLSKGLEPENELDHGRIETRQVSVLKASLLPKEILGGWKGLEGGSIVRVVRDRVIKLTDDKSNDTAWYITSLAPCESNLRRIADTVRAHWSIENRLHWLLDVRFDQDRMQANDPAYIENRAALNRMVLAMTENYRFWLYDQKKTPKLLSVRQVMQRCEDPLVGLECLCCALGLL